MKKKITIIGAGSLGFTRNLIRDLLSFPSFYDAEFMLMDINLEKLSYVEQSIIQLVKEGQHDATVKTTNDRAVALVGADGVIITVLADGVDVWRYDIEIPNEFGVNIAVGDTRGPSGVFRYLRTIPLLLEICHDVEKYCPDAIVLNYTNPMPMICRTLQTMTKANVTGLCHSVQGTSEMLAQWLGADYQNDVTYRCAGINHLAFFLEYKIRGQNAYPQLKKVLTENPEIYEQEVVRNEMFLHLDYYVTESSRHISEYTPWFRKNQNLIEKYCLRGKNHNDGEYGSMLKRYLKRQANWDNELKKVASEKISLVRGREYASYIFNAVFGDRTIFEFNGNVRNFGLIDNLPNGCCVEVPIEASKNGLRPIHIGEIPAQLSALINANAACEEMAVEGYLERNPRKIYHSILYDPLTSAVLDMEQTSKMVDKMFKQNEDRLKSWKRSI